MNTWKVSHIVFWLTSLLFLSYKTQTHLCQIGDKDSVFKAQIELNYETNLTKDLIVDNCYLDTDDKNATFGIWFKYTPINPKAKKEIKDKSAECYSLDYSKKLKNQSTIEPKKNQDKK